MKAHVKAGIKGFSGKLDGAIYYYHPRLKRTLMRRAPKMPIQPQNNDYRDISRKIKEINPSAGYRNDFRIFLNLLMDHDDTVRLPSWYSLYIKMLWAMQAKYPAQVDLKTITRDQIIAEDLPCRSVKRAVEDGLLPEISGYQYLDKDI
ncbi:MAG: hypothetical protein PHY41_04980 [Candidatus Cloacimonetes bacterium]|jgi:hypothetical protein|nr:hypothetical protein [Candidatus Cloacimonadota bacterium]MDY0299017.1 hypothetical protein [Candidatus Cloacimonadaceae bacterium]MCB5279810.1 hypothetical protein [Candidatus Cloacimonadota bacterium]MCK9333604.1 hypothetical protein [Candidatus Cloacimonadota bacterium]MDD2210077.1 hypothetical protein [Candidatus Cloacimonadota bacterium]